MTSYFPLREVVIKPPILPKCFPLRCPAAVAPNTYHSGSQSWLCRSRDTVAWECLTCDPVRCVSTPSLPTLCDTPRCRTDCRHSRRTDISSRTHDMCLCRGPCVRAYSQHFCILLCNIFGVARVGMPARRRGTSSPYPCALASLKILTRSACMS